MRINTNEITATTAAEVKAQVEKQLNGRGCNVVADRAAAEKFFNDCEIEGYLYQDEEQRFQVDGERNGDYQTTITVVVKSFYKDAGSEDYCYSVEATED